MPELPSISGKRLLSLLKADGWVVTKNAPHAKSVFLKKAVGGRTLITQVKDTKEILPPGTLAAILSDEQTRLGRDGLAALIDQYEGGKGRKRS